MGTIPDNKLRLVRNLYYKNLYNARKIAEIIGVSIDAVYYFMRHHGLKRRTFSEENALRFKNKTPSFKIKNNLSARELQLKTIGTVLYWGEGYKGEKSHGIDFTNSDPEMIKVFLKFLRIICGIEESRLRVLIYCYANQNIKELLNFWSRITKISKKQFSKPYVRKDFKINKAGKMPFGLIHIRYMDKKLLMVIKKWIDKYVRIFAQVVP